jgi:hypothetical protein
VISFFNFSISVFSSVSFYQQPLLWFLCAAAIPVAVHLLNRRRHKTLAWAAMQFLLKATRESRGKKKLRHILILTARTLGIACLAFAVARPMIGGLLGWGSSQMDTVILILDRSASMETTADNAAASRRDLAIDRVRDAMKSLDATRLVLIDSATATPQDIPSPESLAEITNTRATDATANIPALLQRAAEFIVETQPGKTEIWIASDMQYGDWDAENERWATAIATLQSAPQKPSVRILSLATPAKTNVSLRLLSSYRSANELLLDLEVMRSGDALTPVNLPLTVALNGTKTNDTITIQGQILRFQKRVKLPPNQADGQGWLSIPGDANPRDNTVYFTYGAARPVKSLVVSTAGEAASYLAAAAAPPGYAAQSCEVIAPAQFSSKIGNLGDYSAIFWNAALPQQTNATAITDFLNNGGQVLFFAPLENSTTSFLDVKWSPITKAPEGKFFILEQWNRDDGLLRDSLSGVPLAGQTLRSIKRQIAEAPPSLATTLATWDDASPFLSRIIIERGTAWFFATTPDYTASNLGDAHLLLPAIQRAVLAGATRFDAALLAEVNRGEALPRNTETRTRIDDYATDPKADSTFSAGVYRLGERVIAANIPAAEYDTLALQKSELKPLFEGITYRTFEDSAASTAESSEREIWKWFLAAVLFFLIAEALLCLPKASAANRASSPQPA